MFIHNLQVNWRQSVTSLWSAINSTTVLISWSPPFTLEGVPILGYNVTITNTTSGENETMSVEGDTTMLYYSIDHPDSDNNFTVAVVPINGAGPGEDAFKSIHIQTPAVGGEYACCCLCNIRLMECV